MRESFWLFSRISKYIVSKFKGSCVDIGTAENLFFHRRSQFILGAGVSAISIGEVFSHKTDTTAVEILGVKKEIAGFKNQVADDLTLIRVEMEAQTSTMNKLLKGFQKLVEEKNPVRVGVAEEKAPSVTTEQKRDNDEKQQVGGNGGSDSKKSAN